MAEKDAELIQALKQAKSKKMFFAFVPKGPEGKLIVSKAKIPPKQIAEAKKEIGGGNAVTGKVFGPVGNLVFTVAKAAPPTLGAALKKVVHRDAGLTIVPDIQLAADADAEEEGAAVAAAPADDVVAAFTNRLKALMPIIQQAQADAASATGQQVKALASEAGAHAGKHDYSKAHSLLDQVESALKGAGKVVTAVVNAVQHQQVVDKKTATDKLIAALEQHPQKAHIAKEIQDAKTKAALALKLAEAPHHKYQEALTALAAIDAACARAQTKAEMFADLEAPTPDVAKLKELAAKPGNDKILDELVKGLDGKTKQKVIAAAIEARFGVKVSQYEHRKVGATKDLSGATAVSPDLPDKSLKRIYELMSKVPTSHVKDNPKLTEIIRFTKDEGGALYSSNTKVYLYLGRADNTQPYQLAKPSELPSVDNECKPKDNNKPDFFDFGTLHEIGHAVDEKKSFMNTYMSGDAYGGWSSTTLAKVAKIAADHFYFDENYIKTKLADGNPPVPAAPTGTSAKDWKAAQDKTDKWCKVMRGGGELWRNGANTTFVAIGDTVYQESYEGDWYSYKLAARKKGITGYQFRAPGEWFAELYAAFHSGKLKDNHPSASWLKTL